MTKFVIGDEICSIGKEPGYRYTINNVIGGHYVLCMRYTDTAGAKVLNLGWYTIPYVEMNMRLATDENVL